MKAVWGCHGCLPIFGSIRGWLNSFTLQCFFGFQTVLEVMLLQNVCFLNNMVVGQLVPFLYGWVETPSWWHGPCISTRLSAGGINTRSSARSTFSYTSSFWVVWVSALEQACRCSQKCTPCILGQIGKYVRICICMVTRP